MREAGHSDSGPGDGVDDDKEISLEPTRFLLNASRGEERAGGLSVSELFLRLHLQARNRPQGSTDQRSPSLRNAPAWHTYPGRILWTRGGL